MSLEDLDAELNAICMDEFGEEVIFAIGGLSRARFMMPGETDEFGVPINRRLPAIELPLTELRRLGATQGSTVVRTRTGTTYVLMNGVADPVVDAGGMAHIELREYAPT